MGIITPQILSIVVCVALRLISYTRTQSDHIMHRKRTRLYCTREQDQIILYMGFDEGRRKERKGGSPMCLRIEVKSERNIQSPLKWPTSSEATLKGDKEAQSPGYFPGAVVNLL